jgi:hypothetical protein
MVRVYSSRKAWRPAEVKGCFWPSGFRFQSFSVSAFRLPLVAGLFEAVFHSQPVEQRALGLLVAGGEFDEAQKMARRVMRAPSAGRA